jgi:hypothetical protein
MVLLSSPSVISASDTPFRDQVHRRLYGAVDSTSLVIDDETLELLAKPLTRPSLVPR